MAKEAFCQLICQAMSKNFAFQLFHFNIIEILQNKGKPTSLCAVDCFRSFSVQEAMSDIQRIGIEGI